MQCWPCERQFATVAARNVSGIAKFEHGLLLDHDPGHPRIGHGEQKEKANDGAGAEVQGGHQGRRQGRRKP